MSIKKGMKTIRKGTYRVGQPRKELEKIMRSR